MARMHRGTSGNPKNALQEVMPRRASIGIPACTSPAIRWYRCGREVGALSIRIGLAGRSPARSPGQRPVLRYNRQLMMAILHDKKASRTGA
jgi:hypothetical protein